MDNKFIMNNIVGEENFCLYDECASTYENAYLTEEDFYPPTDDRTWKSNIEDIDEEDNFVNYCSYIYEYLDEYDYFES